jgi:hypothetical protein
MQSKFRLEPGLQVNTTQNGVTYAPADRLVEWVSVVNGNYQGDHKTPNNFGFTILKSSNGQYRIRQSGIGLDGKPDFLEIESNQCYTGGTLGPITQTDFARVSDAALAKIFEQLRGNSNLAVDIAESGATIRMLRNTLNLKKVFQNVVKNATNTKKFKRLSKGQERLDFVTNKWLEYRYGWMPLVHSIYDALKTVAKPHSGGPVTVKGRSSVATKDIRRSGGGTFFSPTRVETISMKYRAEIVCTFRVPEGQQVYDWTSLNPVGIAWELLPLSFVADWVVNVSDVLSLWENQVIFANYFVGGYATSSYREDYNLLEYGDSTNPVEYYPPNPETGEGGGAPMPGTHSYSYFKRGEAVRLGKNRTVLTQLPVPAQGFRIRPELNAKRFLDAAALFHTFTKSKVRGF